MNIFRFFILVTVLFTVASSVLGQDKNEEFEFTSFLQFQLGGHLTKKASDRDEVSDVGDGQIIYKYKGNCCKEIDGLNIDEIYLTYLPSDTALMSETKFTLESVLVFFENIPQSEELSIVELKATLTSIFGSPAAYDHASEYYWWFIDEKMITLQPRFRSKEVGFKPILIVRTGEYLYRFAPQEK